MMDEEAAYEAIGPDPRCDDGTNQGELPEGNTDGFRLIGIHGYKRAGKHETAYAISDLLEVMGETARIRAFADKMKVAAAKALGYDGEDGDLIVLIDKMKDDGGQVTSEYVTNAPFSGLPIIAQQRLKGRQFLVTFGQGMRAVFGQDFWVNQVLPNPATHEYAEHPDWYQIMRDEMASEYGDALLIPDVRMPNEAQRIIDLGGEVWDVRRPGFGSDGSETEQGLPEHLITRVIDNSADRDHLRVQVAEALSC